MATPATYKGPAGAGLAMQHLQEVRAQWRCSPHVGLYRIHEHKELGDHTVWSQALSPGTATSGQQPLLLPRAEQNKQGREKQKQTMQIP